MARGKLRIYLGAAPGVGKTYKMLEEGRRRRDRGTDVVVGYVETHDRPHTTALVEGLETVPRTRLDHRGVEFEEMDLDGILARNPAVVLVDELAHTNVSGARNVKRWQDVEAILDAGIEVITTVNVQHLESLNDVTEAIVGVRQRETVPDEVVRAADQIELVDMSPQALRRRMAHGNIYKPEKVDAALSNYFREGNLTALRELALLWVADRVEEGLERYRADHDIDSTWATRDRIIVPVSGGPESTALMRRAARVSSRRSGGEWMALYVTQQDGLSGVSPDRLTALQAKTEHLGGTFHTVVGDDPAEAILDFARAENASQIIIGASRRGRFPTLMRPGIGERVIDGSGEIDVLVVTHDYAGRRAHSRPRPTRDNLGRRRRLAGYLFGILAPLVTSLLLWWTSASHGLSTESMFLMVVVVITALIGGLVPAIIAAVGSGLLLNFLFTPPLYTWTIADAENAVAILLFIVVGIAVASVVDRAARVTEQAHGARAEANALTVLSHSLLTSTDDLAGLLRSATSLFGAAGASVIHEEPDGTRVTVASHGRTPTMDGGRQCSVDIDDHTTLSLTAPDLTPSQRRLLKAYAAYAKVMTERKLATAADLERLRLADADRTRTALLAAVSHDLRTPLAAVRAAVDSLRSQEVTWSPADEAELLSIIDDGTTRLATLVDNLLDMSRIHTGAVTPAVTEVGLASAVLNALRPLDDAHRIDVTVDPRLTILADSGLLDRVLANICDNALKYTPVDAAIRIDAAHTNGHVTLRIADSGPGVHDRNHDRLFAPFQRLGDVPQNDGVGLGLAVARGFTEAMNGTITTEDTPGGGLTFVLEFPAAQDQTAEPPDSMA
ncbi:ATP-binding protein [Aeromicrobium sp. CTD01-1L150]|uniref:ATP-binding protein n=1 Tax=Aeromicrobium sp. CTD01-1L150 TaxID=3341830 RepID=UPI0035C248B6